MAALNAERIVFQRRTLIVVGAGASAELGLPTGAGLRTILSQILDIRFSNQGQISGDTQLPFFLQQRAQTSGNTDWNYLLKRCWLLRDALPGSLSIDNLLDAHAKDEDVVYCGKLALAKAILSAENGSSLYTNDEIYSTVFQRAAGSWLIPFFQLLSEGIRLQDVRNVFHNLIFLNFNYDRCIEYFLPLALSKYYGIPQSDAQTIVNAANIIHPYGQVGQVHGDVLRTTPFGSTQCDLNLIADGIRTFSEGMRDDRLGELIASACRVSDQIIFLGFAFHPLNMRIMETESPSNVKKIFATTLGLNDAAKKVVNDTLLATLNKYSPERSARSTSDNGYLLDEMNLDSVGAHDFLLAHFRGIA